jgi:hypothetical protein
MTDIQPTLAFSQRRPGLSGTKTKSSTSITSIDLDLDSKSGTENVDGKLSRTPSTNIDLTLDDQKTASTPVKSEGTKDGRKKLNPKSKEWAKAYADAKVEMGNMEPSTSTCVVPMMGEGLIGSSCGSGNA